MGYNNEAGSRNIWREEHNSQAKEKQKTKNIFGRRTEKIIDEVWDEIRAEARLLYYEIRKKGYRIPHNKIHSYLKETGRTIWKSKE